MTERNAPKLSEAVTRAGLVAWSIVGIMVVVWACVWILGRAHVLIAPIVLSVALIYLLNPVVTRLQARGVARLFGSVLAFVTFIGALVLAGWLVFPNIGQQASQLGGDFPEIYEGSTSQIEDLLATVGFDVELWSYDRIEEFISDPENQDQFFSVAFDRIGALTSGVLEAVLVFFLAPAIAFYVLLDLPRVRRETIELIPPQYREEVLYVATQVGKAVGGFLRGQLFVAFIVGTLMSFGFWLIGLEFWLVVGMLSGFLNIIPFVGPWVGGILGVMVGIVTGSVSTAFAAGIVAIVVQQIDNHFVSPTVLRATVRLHPAVVILVLILGGAIGGVWGVILAVPVTASIKIVAGHLWRTRVLGQSWEEATEALIEEPPPHEPFRIRRRPEGGAPPVGAAAADPGGGIAKPEERSADEPRGE